MHRILTLSLPLLLLLPDVANAASGGGALADVSATIVAYAKILLFAAGVFQIVRIVFLHMENRPTGAAILVLAGTIVIPAIFLVAWSHSGAGNAPSNSAFSGGRPFIEFTLSQIGLLNANSVWRWDTFQLLFIAVVFAAMAAIFLRLQSSNDDQQSWSQIKSWAVTSIVIFAIFQPGWTTKGAATSAEVISKIGGKTLQTTPPPMGSVSPSDAVVQNLSQQNFRLTRSTNPQIPTVLAVVNEAMDDFVGALSVKFGTETFAQMGLIQTRQMLAGLSFNLPDKLVDRQLKEFIWGCWGTLIQRRRIDTGKGVTKTNIKNFNPFSSIYLPEYRRMGGLCAEMTAGNYSYNGQHYPQPLQDQVLGNLAWADDGLRGYYHWKSLDQAIAAAPTLRRLLYNNPSSNFNFANLEDALMARVAEGAFSRSNAFNLGTAGEMVQRQRTQTNDNWFTSIAGLFGGQGLALVESAKGAANSENVNLRMPIFFGLLQCLLLSLFPVVFALAMLPGRAGWMGHYFTTLLWSKSYIIGWALVSQIDMALSSMQMTTAQELAVINVIQQAQLFSPLAMAIVIFGPAVAVQSMARGGGAA